MSSTAAIHSCSLVPAGLFGFRVPYNTSLLSWMIARVVLSLMMYDPFDVNSLINISADILSTITTLPNGVLMYPKTGSGFSSRPNAMDIAPGCIDVMVGAICCC